MTDLLQSGILRIYNACIKAKKHTALIHAKVRAVLLTIASGPLVQMSTR